MAAHSNRLDWHALTGNREAALRSELAVGVDDQGAAVERYDADWFLFKNVLQSHGFCKDKVVAYSLVVFILRLPKLDY